MAYAKRYAGGFVDKPTLTTPIDSTFLNAVEAALLALYDAAPGAANMVPVWTPGGTHYVPQLLTNASIDPAAAIAKSKLANLAIADADVAGGAAISRSKLNFGAGLVDADIANTAAISSSKLAIGVYGSYSPIWTSDATQPALGNGSLTGVYAQIGKFVTGYLVLVAGSTTTFGSGFYLFTLPTGIAGPVELVTGVGRYSEQSTGNTYTYMGYNSDSVHCYMSQTNLTGTGATTYLGAANPVAWANADQFAFSFSYQST